MRAKKSRKRSAPAKRRSVNQRTVRKIVERVEAVRQGPLQPEVPVDPDAPVAALDPDALEVLHDTQEVADETPPDWKIVTEPRVDRERATVLAGGDVDAVPEEVDSGEEAVGGSTPTPDQDVVDDLGRAAGVTYGDSEPLRPEEKEAERDAERWELDPASSEDYPDRLRQLRRRDTNKPR